MSRSKSTNYSANYFDKYLSELKKNEKQTQIN